MKHAKYKIIYVIFFLGIIYVMLKDNKIKHLITPKLRINIYKDQRNQDRHHTYSNNSRIVDISFIVNFFPFFILLA
jgi:hypothetical protein